MDARDWDHAERVIAHVDMDAFYAAVEMRDDPALRGMPVLIGVRGARSVVATASYEARAFGCHSAMPMSQALRRCPHAVVVRPRIAHYAAVSAEIFAEFERFSPAVEGLSLDEAFLDLTGTQRLHGPPPAAARAIKRAVFERVGLTCSVGISTRKFVAKVASGRNKPDGLTVVEPGTEAAFVAPLGIGELPGVGTHARTLFQRAGYRTVGALALASRNQVQRTLGDQGVSAWLLAHGVDDREIDSDRQAKQVSCEDTYAVDLRGTEALHRALLRQSAELADRLRASGMRARTLRLKIRDDAFRTESRQRRLLRSTAEASTIYDVARALLERVDLDGRGFRLTGLAGAGLVEVDEDGHERPVDAGDSGARTAPPITPRPATQLLLDIGGAEIGGGAPPAMDEHAVADATEASASERKRRLQDAMTAVRSRYGRRALQPADVVEPREQGDDDDVNGIG